MSCLSSRDRQYATYLQMEVLTWFSAGALHCASIPSSLGRVAAIKPTGDELCCWLANHIAGMPGAQSVNIFSDHGTCYAATLHDGKLDMNDLEQVMAFDGLLLNALNGTALECDSAGLSCKVFDGDLKVQTPISTGTPGACAVIFTNQEFDWELSA